MSDYDGDLCCVTDNPTFIKTRYKDEANSLPITYEKKTVPKGEIQEKNLYKADLDSFDTTIGQVTNYSTSFYDLLCKFKGKTDEYSIKCYNEILERLKLTRMEQGNAIDAAKGIRVDPYPSIWIKQQKILPTDTEEDRKQKEFLNDICADRKPLFFIYRYPQLNKEYREYMEGMERICYCLFDKHIEDIIRKEDKDLSQKEIDFKKRYYKYCPVIDFNSPMNQIFRHVKSELSEIKNYGKEKTSPEVIELMKAEECSVSKEDIERIDYYYKKYISKKKEIQKRKNCTIKNISEIVQEDNIVNIEQYAKYIRREAEEYFAINHEGKKSIMESIANAVVEYCYVLYPSKSKAFVWDVFGKYVVHNILNNTLKENKYTTVPIKDKNGSIEYLGNKYSEKVIELESDDDE